MGSNDLPCVSPHGTPSDLVKRSAATRVLQILLQRPTLTAWQMNGHAMAKAASGRVYWQAAPVYGMRGHRQ